ncbi:site-specific DNA-methyltransferase [Nitrosomonas supralitoralis]|uniref:site-specific DNA-methyltransferase (adenine-specific) n=1 Tax=Nitrosomonas supralitoralis TaxID=2116706 RepID=A0A2P7NSU9_9PROT|nr:site-specific DNA-methyltransferase [Nitrosomonas supralitoralis]PSJ16553.1 site-specific DNA-methyltransferase [Nitrosomonas supralitoralis]
MSKKHKLELTWIGKENQPKLEPRILLEDPTKSYHAKHRVKDNDIFDNQLIFGDNLLALKALEAEFSGKVKCIYIDPPYNTGQAFEHYDDGIEASLWLSLMSERLRQLSRLLKNDGVIFVQIDDNYFAHLKLVMDEVFGVSQYINTIAVKTKESSGASGGGEDRRLKKNIEFVLAYGGKDFVSFNSVFSETELDNYLELMRLEGKSFKYTSVLYRLGKKTFVKTIKDGGGSDMQLYKIEDYETRSISRLAKEEGLSEAQVIYKYYDKVHTTENAQTSIRTRVQDATDSLDNMYSLEYIPVSGRNKGTLTELLFVGPQKRLVSWFSNVTYKKGKKIIKREKLGTFWDDLNWNNVTREGGVRFPNGQKPEKLISICLELATAPGDLVLDSFLGSGTTAAVAHKMGRRWIGIELGEHCHTHCAPRMQSVIDGTDQSGISELTGWSGGGGFRYYKLAPSLLQLDTYGQWVINKEYNAEMLAQALCKLEGFTYAPSGVHYWIHGYSTERDFIYVTTANLNHEQLQQLSDEVGSERSLLVLCTAFRGRGDYPNLTVKKIPKQVLSRCEWGHDDYSLRVENLPKAPPPQQVENTKTKGHSAANSVQSGLFDEEME